uniref:Uncharacterized protein n=1 Tax=Anguilla anguilla TaxID=7936 RepID=A0A0E9TXX9_ANGAN
MMDAFCSCCFGLSGLLNW